MDQPSSNIFEGFKSLGYITGPLPFIIRHASDTKDTRIITIVDRTFHCYTLNGTLVEVSVPHEEQVKVVIADSKHVYTGSGRTVFVWARGSKKLVQRLDRGHQADVRLLSKFGNSRIVSIDDDNVLFNWKIGDDKEILNIINFDIHSFEITSICHPFNYKDKVLFGSKQGTLQLWNIVHEECLYKFEGWNSPVTCIVHSPVLDVVGIGLEDGHIRIHNVRYDESLMSMVQDYGPVTSMSFRLDGSPYLVTSSEPGHLCIWNIERKCISTQIRSAHAGRISCCKFIRDESLLVTSGSDNCIKIWSLDGSDGGGNLLSQRAGHIGPPEFVRFYDKFNILSAGKDSSLKSFNILSERFSKNLGTAKKFKPIVRFSTSSTREKQWDNIAACHENSSLVTLWNYDKCKLGENIIRQPTFDNHAVHASEVCVSPCGNFVVIGFSNGFIFKYNMQSGRFRLTFESPDSSEHKAHSDSLSGLCVNSLGLMMASASIDGFLKIWNFKNGQLMRQLYLKVPIRLMDLHSENNLLGLAIEGGIIKVLELDTFNFVRNFEGLSTILDMTFSPDARWLIASYEDKSIKTWDLYLGKLIDAFALSSACLSVSLSPTGEFLATVLEGTQGIMVWSNITLYVPTPIRIVDIYAKVPTLDIPHFCSDERAEGEEEESDDITVMKLGVEEKHRYISPEQLHAEMIELSHLPASRWKNLLRVDEIRKQQKIAEEKKNDKKIQIPFFLPVKEGLKPKLEIQEDGDKFMPPIVKALSHYSKTSNYVQFIEHLKELGPSQTDAEIRSLSIGTCNSHKPLMNFLDAIKYLFEKNLDFELASSWLALCLKIHAEEIEDNTELVDKCNELKHIMNEKWTKIKHKFTQSFSVLNYIRFSAL